MSFAMLTTSVLTVLSTLCGLEVPQEDLEFLHTVQIGVEQFSLKLQMLWSLAAFLTLIMYYDHTLAWRHINEPRVAAHARALFKSLMAMLVLGFTILAFGLQSVLGGVLMFLTISRRYHLALLFMLVVLVFLSLKFEEEKKYRSYFFF